jgi:hypothetical protein
MIWAVKDGSSSANKSIPASCWAQDPIQLKVNSTPVGDPPTCNVIYSCWDGAIFSDIYTNGDGCPNGYNFYEDALWWNTQEDCRQLTSDTVPQTDVTAHASWGQPWCFADSGSSSSLDCAGHTIDGSVLTDVIDRGYPVPVTFNNCTITANITTPDWYYASIVLWSGNATINNSHIICDNKNNQGIFVDASLTNITIQNTVIENCGVGIVMNSSTTLVNVTYIDNFYDSCMGGTCVPGDAYSTSCRELAGDIVLQTDVNATGSTVWGGGYCFVEPTISSGIDCAGHSIIGELQYNALEHDYASPAYAIYNNCSFAVNITNLLPMDMWAAEINLFQNNATINNSHITCLGANQSGIAIDGGLTGITIQNTLIENCFVGIDIPRNISQPNFVSLVNVTYHNNYYDVCSDSDGCVGGDAYPQMVLRYDGSGNSTHLYDASGNGNDGTIQGTVVKHTGYFDLDGIGSILLPSITLGTNWTIQTWVRLFGTTPIFNVAPIVGYSYDKINYPGFGTFDFYNATWVGHYNGMLEGEGADGGSTAYTDVEYNESDVNGKWIMVALVGTDMDIYAYLDNRSPDYSGGVPITINANQLTIGNITHPDPTHTIFDPIPLNGSMSNFTIYNYARSPSQIAADFAAGDPIYNPTATPTPTASPSGNPNYITARVVVGNSLSVFQLLSSWQALIVLTVAGGAILAIVGSHLGSSGSE